MLRLEAELEESHPRKGEWTVQSTEVGRPSGVTAWRVRKPWPGWRWKGWGWLGRVMEASTPGTPGALHWVENSFEGVRVVTWTPIRT